MKENIIKLDLKSFQDMCKTIEELTNENQDLKLDNDFLQRQNNACKMRCSKYLTSEEAGRRFAQELLGGA